jgi:plasmid stabilization system protein ParE
MHTRLSEDAIGDLEALKNYVEPRSPRGYVVVLASIFTTMEQLETFPFLGRIGDVEGTREMTVPGTDYRVIYRLNEPYFIEIIGIWHGKRKYPPDA